MANIQDMVVERLEQGEEVALDDFGIEVVSKDPERKCLRCGSRYHRKHGGWGSICFICEQPWYDGFFVPSDDEEEE